MFIEATSKVIKYRLRDGQELLLEPGRPVDLPDEAARYLLEKAPDRVRLAGGADQQVAMWRESLANLTKGDANLVVERVGQLSPVFWLSEGSIVGPGRVLAAAKATAHDGADEFWLCVELSGTWRWVLNVLLRSKRAFEAQQQAEAVSNGLFGNDQNDQ